MGLFKQMPTIYDFKQEKMYSPVNPIPNELHHENKNSAEVDIAPAFGEITTACNAGQAKKGHGACFKSGQLVYARFHTHSHRCCREMYFNSRPDVNFLNLTQNIDKVSGA